jgi:serine/threonine-protein kinase
MSPEQATGEHDLDARTDIFALGCVLQEMVTGKPPFSGRTLQAVIAQHLTEAPPPLREVRPETPPWLERVVRTALANSPDERLPSAEQFSQSLTAHVAPRRRLRAAVWRRWVTRLRRRRQFAYGAVIALLLIGGAYAIDKLFREGGILGRSSSPVATIAVLPFQEFGADGASHLAAGFTYYLAEYLGAIRGLAVVSPESMHRYDREGFPVDSIVARHGLDMLIGGSVGVTDQQIEVSAGLTDAASRVRTANIDPLTRPRAEEALLLRDLAEEVGRLLRRQLGSRIERIEAEAVTTCAQCLENFFEARAFREQAWSRRTAGDSSGAMVALEQADSLLALAESGDPEWSDPIVERGWMAADRAGLTGVMRTYDADWTHLGMGHAERALETDPSDARAFQLRGNLRIYLAENSGDPEEMARLWEGAQSDLEQAVGLKPSLAAAWSRLSYVYWERGNFERAKSAAERALEEDVWLHNDAITMIRLCQAVLELEQFQEVSHWCIEEGRLRFPANPTFVHVELTVLASDVVGVFPDVNRAWGLADTLVQLMRPQRRAGTRLWVDMDVAAVLARAGLEDSARAVIGRARAASPEENPRLDYHEANARLQFGEVEETLRLLERYLNAQPARRSRIAKDWWFKPLREDSRFKGLVAE